MKRKKPRDSIYVFIGYEVTKCSKCLHVRKGEPYVRVRHFRGDLQIGADAVCWRCCRDAESTFMIKQKWPLAFERVSYCEYWRLHWSPGVKELVGEHEKA